MNRTLTPFTLEATDDMLMMDAPSGCSNIWKNVEKKGHEPCLTAAYQLFRSS
jgi:hypothetical protein